jgi:putative FmdB family regulatory protein
MPIYEYQCPKCGQFEITQRITEDALKKCPTCRSKVRKLISNTSFQLKGSGWYVTDYAKKGAGKETSDSGKDAGSSGGKDSAASGGESTATSGGGESKSGESKSTDTSNSTKPEAGKTAKKKDAA